MVLWCIGPYRSWHYRSPECGRIASWHDRRLTCWSVVCRWWLLCGLCRHCRASTYLGCRIHLLSRSPCHARNHSQRDAQHATNSTGNPDSLPREHQDAETTAISSKRLGYLHEFSRQSSTTTRIKTRYSQHETNECRRARTNYARMRRGGKLLLYLRRPRFVLQKLTQPPDPTQRCPSNAHEVYASTARKQP